MPSHRFVGTVMVGALVVASCGHTDHGTLPPVRSAPREADAGPSAVKVADRDNDGIADDVDRCPDDPEDCDGFEDADGCPDDDNDGDGIPDRCDKCPDFPARTPTGCERIIYNVGPERLLYGVSFEIHGVKPSSGEELLDSVTTLTKDEHVKRVGLVGHALAKEKDAARLATRRAEVVKNALVGRGVPLAKLELRAAPVGDVDDCPPAGDGSSPRACVTFALVEGEDRHMVWNGSRYVEDPPPPPAPTPPPPVCPPPPPRAAGHPCGEP